MATKSSARMSTLSASVSSSPLVVEVPADMSATVLSDTSVELSWSMVDDPLAFTVAWLEAGGSSWTKVSVAGDLRSYVVSGLRPGTSYAFQMQSQSAWSDPVEAETTGSALAPPTLTVTDILDRNANVNVLTPDLAGQARVVEAQVKDTRTNSPWYSISDVPFNLAPMGPYDASFGLKMLSTGVTYAVRVRVTVAGETSDWTPELRFTTTGTKGGKPGLTVVADSATFSSVKLAWSTSVKSQVRFIRWVRSSSPGSSPFLPQQVGYSNDLSGVFEDVGLSSGADYWYTVEWVRDARTISISNPVAVRTR
ncbi:MULTISPECIES: fibronectin type III domain-containing protein [unclassified Streptomyces]|uniref:fibronectin type III domain-containing protein n=1 Tax=unclassified Streptomyces TaxID=2593676 RepID=UPI0033B79792